MKEENACVEGESSRAAEIVPDGDRRLNKRQAEEEREGSRRVERKPRGMADPEPSCCGKRAAPDSSRAGSMPSSTGKQRTSRVLLADDNDGTAEQEAEQQAFDAAWVLYELFHGVSPAAIIIPTAVQSSSVNKHVHWVQKMPRSGRSKKSEFEEKRRRSESSMMRSFRKLPPVLDDVCPSYNPCVQVLPTAAVDTAVKQEQQEQDTATEEERSGVTAGVGGTELDYSDGRLRKPGSESSHDDSVQPDSHAESPSSASNADAVGLLPKLLLEEGVVALSSAFQGKRIGSSDVKSELVKLEGRRWQRSGAFALGKLKPAMSEEEKEAQRVRRVQANRESARQTIRRKQMLCEQLVQKAASLLVEKEDLKQKLESQSTEYRALLEMNRCLKEQASLDAANDMMESPVSARQGSVVPALPCVRPSLPKFWWAFALAQEATASRASGAGTDRSLGSGALNSEKQIVREKNVLCSLSEGSAMSKSEERIVGSTFQLGGDFRTLYSALPQSSPVTGCMGRFQPSFSAEGLKLMASSSLHPADDFWYVPAGQIPHRKFSKLSVNPCVVSSFAGVGASFKANCGPAPPVVSGAAAAAATEARRRRWELKRSRSLQSHQGA